MQPIFKEQINMWKDLGYDIPIEEGMYWLDRGIIKAFTSDGKIHNLYKYKVNDDLTIQISKHKDYKSVFVFETWDATIERMNDRLNELENESINFLNSYINCGRECVATNSTGKDSMVVYKLAQKSELRFETYFNVTTLDVAESNLMAKRLAFNFTYPDLKKYGGFYQWIEYENIIPTRLNRACCTIFKEKATIDYFPSDKKMLFLFGMRNAESNLRSGYTDIWINEKWGKRDWIGLLPIRKWSDFDIWLYIFRENIDINLKYRMGYSRVGCGIACPNYSKSTWVLDKYWYPNMYQRWRNILRDDFIRNNKWLIMNCTMDEYINKGWNGGVFRSKPTSEVIDEYTEISGLNRDIAENYFNRYCINNCLNKRHQPMKIKDKNTLAMNMKYYGRNTTKFLCKKCFMKEMGWTKEQWDKQVEDFKLSGCALF